MSRHEIVSAPWIKPTYGEKLSVFSNLTYWDARFPTPPVPTNEWTPVDWVNWVAQNGSWFTRVREKCDG